MRRSPGWPPPRPAEPGRRHTRHAGALRVDRLDGSLADTTASLSRIEDTDMAAEMSDLTPSQVLTQAGTAMPAQAVQAPQYLVRLLAA